MFEITGVGLLAYSPAPSPLAEKIRGVEEGSSFRYLPGLGAIVVPELFAPGSGVKCFVYLLFLYKSEVMRNLTVVAGTSSRAS